jgi:hypothetical protein
MDWGINVCAAAGGAAARRRMAVRSKKDVRFMVGPE